MQAQEQVVFFCLELSVSDVKMLLDHLSPMTWRMAGGSSRFPLQCTSCIAADRRHSPHNPAPREFQVRAARLNTRLDPDLSETLAFYTSSVLQCHDLHDQDTVDKVRMLSYGVSLSGSNSLHARSICLAERKHPRTVKAI